MDYLSSLQKLPYLMNRNFHDGTTQDDKCLEIFQNLKELITHFGIQKLNIEGYANECLRPHFFCRITKNLTLCPESKMHVCHLSIKDQQLIEKDETMINDDLSNLDSFFSLFRKNSADEPDIRIFSLENQTAHILIGASRKELYSEMKKYLIIEEDLKITEKRSAHSQAIYKESIVSRVIDFFFQLIDSLLTRIKWW